MLFIFCNTFTDNNFETTRCMDCGVQVRQDPQVRSMSQFLEVVQRQWPAPANSLSTRHEGPCNDIFKWFFFANVGWVFFFVEFVWIVRFQVDAQSSSDFRFVKFRLSFVPRFFLQKMRIFAWIWTIVIEDNLHGEKNAWTIFLSTFNFKVFSS